MVLMCKMVCIFVFVDEMLFPFLVGKMYFLLKYLYCYLEQLLLRIHHTAAADKQQTHELKLRPASMNNLLMLLSIGRILQAIRWISGLGCIGVRCGSTTASVS